MKRAVLQYGVAKYITVIINLLLTSILSRLLTPSDYGTMSIIMVFISFFNILSTMGIGTGVIQNKTLNCDETNGIFTFSVVCSFIIWILFILLAYPVAWFYADNQYIHIMHILSFSVFFSALNVVPSAVVLKEEKFKQIAIRMIVSSCISGVISIIIALNGGKYYALVVQNVLQAVIQFFWNEYYVRLKFIKKPNLTGLKEIASYSLYQFLYSVILSLSQNLDNLLTGKYLGKEQLAYYNKSYTVMRYPIDYIPHALSPVMHPVLSKYQDDLDYIYSQYIKVIKVLSAIGMYVSLIFIWEAPEIIRILFGEQWENSIGVFRIFGFSIWFQIVNALAGSIYQSVNETRNMFISGIMHISFTIMAIIVGILQKSTTVLAISLTVSWIIKFIIESFFLVQKSLKKSVIQFWKNFIPEALIFVLSMFLCRRIFEEHIFGVLFMAIFKTIIISLIYVFLYTIFGQTKHIKVLLKNGKAKC